MCGWQVQKSARSFFPVLLKTRSLCRGTSRTVEQCARGHHGVQDPCLLLMWLSWQAAAEPKLPYSVPALSSASLRDFEKLTSWEDDVQLCSDDQGFWEARKICRWSAFSLGSHHWALNPETSVTVVCSFGLKLTADRNCLLSFHAGKSSGRICHTREVLG